MSQEAVAANNKSQARCIERLNTLNFPENRNLEREAQIKAEVLPILEPLKHAFDVMVAQIATSEEYYTQADDEAKTIGWVLGSIETLSALLSPRHLNATIFAQGVKS